ncbi:MAG: PQQ-binding-like beta-propeller repeat protein [Limisphaerales bacterium]
MRTLAPVGSLRAAWLALALSFGANAGGGWNQWLGGPERTLNASLQSTTDSPPTFTEFWRRPMGSGFAGFSVDAGHGITAMTDGRQDVAVLLDAATGFERWRFTLGRTRKRAEGVPLGPLSTPAIDAEAAYVQALDGRFVCLDRASGQLRWEVNLKRAFQAYEPGYGFASSPLLLPDLVVLLPAGSSANSAVALDRRTGEVRWKASLGTATEYASAAWLPQPGRGGGQIIAALGTRLAGLAPEDGRLLWALDGVAGGLWTPSTLTGGRVFFPTAQVTRLLEPAGDAAREIWNSPVFEGVMGPVVELDGMLIGHHERRLTALDATAGRQLWQRPAETDGQLLVLGKWLVFVNDRAGTLEVLVVTPQGCEAVHRQPVLKPTRMESPLAFADGLLFLRAPEELVALRVR